MTPKEYYSSQKLKRLWFRLLVITLFTGATIGAFIAPYVAELIQSI